MVQGQQILMLYSAYTLLSSRTAYAEESESDNRDDSTRESNKHCSPRLEHHVSHSTNSHTSSKSSILNMNLQQKKKCTSNSYAQYCSNFNINHDYRIYSNRT